MVDWTASRIVIDQIDAVGRRNAVAGANTVSIGETADAAGILPTLVVAKLNPHKFSSTLAREYALA